mgnify:CR=1 FL=1
MLHTIRHTFVSVPPGLARVFVLLLFMFVPTESDIACPPSDQGCTNFHPRVELPCECFAATGCTSTGQVTYAYYFCGSGGQYGHCEMEEGVCGEKWNCNTDYDVSAIIASLLGIVECTGACYTCISTGAYMDVRAAWHV